MATKTKVDTTFLKSLKKGNTVILCAFTGMKIGVKEVIAADKATVTLDTNKGEAVFDRKTGKQIDPEPKAERFANYLIEDDGSFVPPTRKPKAKKKAKPEPEVTEEDLDEDEDIEEEEKPVKKPTKKSPAKKSKPAPEPELEEDDDDDDDEDWDDDDFEEVE
jgi:DNA-directed RNA polymerase alpha subunit